MTPEEMQARIAQLEEALRDHLQQLEHTETVAELEQCRKERDANRAALDERNEFTSKRVLGELEKHGVVLGAQYDKLAAAARQAQEALERYFQMRPNASSHVLVGHSQELRSALTALVEALPTKEEP